MVDLGVEEVAETSGAGSEISRDPADVEPDSRVDERVYEDISEAEVEERECPESPDEDASYSSGKVYEISSGSSDSSTE